MKRYILWPAVVAPVNSYSYKLWWDERKWKVWRARCRVAAGNGTGRSDFTGKGDK